jgi:putative pyruvate formate lyase activating enzyme
MTHPRYLILHESGELKRRVEQGMASLNHCTLCPHACGANRLLGETGKCRTGHLSRIASHGPHFGEESPLVGSRGSGTVFFCGCNLNCTFCQNSDISQGTGGREVDGEDLSRVFLQVQKLGCANLNLVTPTHVVPQILQALFIAANEGLRLPLVWNSGGYESISTLYLLDGIVDIYMPDLKFMDEEPSREFLDAPDYPKRAQSAIREMHRQVGELKIGKDNLAVNGLLVRHLIMPGGLAGSEKAISFLANEVSPNTYLNIMNQYRPCHLSIGDPLIGSSPRIERWLRARKLALNAGLRLDK